MNRRTFLLGASTATAALSLPRLAGAAIPATFSIPAIDTHTHFYDPTRPEGIPWPPASNALLHRPVLPPEFTALTSRHHVVGTVIVEASDRVEDNQWILDLATRDESIVGFVGHLKPGTPGFAANLRRFAANPFFRGLRLRLADLNRLGDPAHDAELRRIADAGLSVDVLGGAATLGKVEALAAAFPALPIVINHLPFKDWDGQPAAARTALRKVAAQQNVVVKLSEVVRRVNDVIIEDPAFYRPMLDTLLDLFGPERVLFGSNWPVSDRIAPYASVYRVVADYFASQPRAVAERYFWRNSLAIYRWQPRGAAAGLVRI
jgi:L-fuconolactonase